MTEYTRTHDPFEYHAEDLHCVDCLHFKEECKAQEHGCGENSCRYEDIRAEATANGRIKRKAGHFKWQE